MGEFLAAVFAAVTQAGALPFEEVITADKGFPEENTATRQEMEAAATTWLVNSPNDYVDYCVRFDVIAIIALSPDRAFIRHHVNAFADFSASEAQAS